MYGAVLAGGRSRRFGSDKAVADWDGRTFVRTVCELLGCVGCDPVVAIGRESTPGRSTWPRWLPDAATDEHRHPLYGVAAASQVAAAAGSGLLVAAVDQPFLKVDWLHSLVAAGRADDAAAAFVSSDGDRFEPLPLFVPRSKVDDFAAIVDGVHTREERSLQSIYRSAGVRRIARPPDWGALGSLNRPTDHP